MPIARHPSPEDVECLLRNAELRDQIEPYLDESIHEIDFAAMPTAIENRFLESMLAWEQAPLIPIARWFDPPLLLQPAGLLDDETLRERLWETTAPTSATDRPAKHATAFLIRQSAAEGGFRTWLFSETGDLILARLTRQGYEELGRTHLLDPTNECFGRPN